MNQLANEITLTTVCVLTSMDVVDLYNNTISPSTGMVFLLVIFLIWYGRDLNENFGLGVVMKKVNRGASLVAMVEFKALT